MVMKKKHRAQADMAFDHLLEERYGAAGYVPRDRLAFRWLPESTEELLSGRYGRQHHHHSHHKRHKAPSVGLQFSVDDGETLRSGNGAAAFEEYVVERSLSDEVFEEYVVDRLPPPEPVVRSASVAETSPDPRQECNVDVLDVHGLQADSTPSSQPATATDAASRLPNAIPTKAAPTVQTPRAVAIPDGGLTSAQSSVATSDVSANPSDDDFIADMKAILNGEKVYDGGSKSMKPRDSESSRPPAQQQNAPDPTFSNGQAIFDKIAENMRYANAYDLGSVELNNRFSEFDRQWDREQEAETARRRRHAEARRPPGDEKERPRVGEKEWPAGSDRPRPASHQNEPPPPSTEDFISDLDAVRRDALARTEADEPRKELPATGQSSTSTAQDLDPGAGTLWGDATSPDARVFALDVGTGGQLSDKFVAQAQKVSFSNASDINSYFAQFGTAGFVTWFNKNAANHGPWANRALGSSSAVEGNFTAIWNRIPQVFGTPSINLLQFLGLMSILVNEVGGTLAPISERVGTKDHPGLAYAFDRIEGLKLSYNTGSLSKTAFACFNDPDFIQAHGSKPKGAQLQNTTDERWKGDVWPAELAPTVDPAVNGFIMEADFYKFRGRGLIQTTWRSGYKDLIDFVQSYTGTQQAILTRRQQWTGLSKDKAASISSNADWDDLFMSSGLEIPCVAIAQHNNRAGHYLALSSTTATLNATGTGSIWNIGRQISGASKYADLFRNRVIAACNLLGN